MSPLARDKQEPPGKQYTQQQKYIASPIAASQLAKQALPHASLHADLPPAGHISEYHFCKLCNAAFSSISRLVRHTQDSTCNKPKYKLCEQTFATKNILHQHIREDFQYSRKNRIQSSKCDLSSESPQILAAPRSAASTLISAEISSRPTVITTPTFPAAPSNPTVKARSAPTTPPATPPPTYRAVSPPPPAYKAKKAYLTIEDLYMRYAPLKALWSARQSARQPAYSKATATSSYLTIHDLFRRFSKRTSAKSLARQDKYVPDLETSAIDSVRSRKSNAKTSDIYFLPQVQILHQQRYRATPTRIPLANTPSRPYRV